MKNMILFFLLLATTTTYAQYWKKHPAGLHLPISMHQNNLQFNIKTSGSINSPASYKQFLYSDHELLKTHDVSPIEKNMIHVSLQDPYLESNKPLHSAYVYDLRGKLVTSKLSYRIKTKH